MTTANFAADSVRKQLHRVLANSSFARNHRLSRFLQFVVERKLEGRDHELKESLIAVEVFGRKPDYDPKQDSIVRSEAARLRARLIEYYSGPGREDQLIIELPKGGYTPSYRQVEAPLAGIRSGYGWLTLTMALVALAAAALVAGWSWNRHKTATLPIAVLPLTNLSPDPANEYFSDGLTDEIIRNLSIIDGLAVRSQTSSYAFKGKPRNVREVGQQLNVDYILEGSVVRTGQQLRINAQLIRVRDDSPVWSGRYDREVRDILAIQDEISRGIVNSLRLKLGRGRRRYETNVEAYDLYLRGRALQIQRGVAGRREGIGLFREAIAKDPSFAPAYAGLAAGYASRSGESEFGQSDDVRNMRAAADKAIELDPLLAEAHAALGIAFARESRWEQAEKSFRRAIELDPGRSMSYGDLSANLLLPLGRTDEAIILMRVAEKSDPLSPDVHYRLAWPLISAGRYAEAAESCRILPPNHSGKSECMGRVLLGQGKIAEAIEFMAAITSRGVPEGASIWGYLGYAYGRAGRPGDAEKIANAVAPRPFQQALIFAGLGDKDRTLEALERMRTLGPIRVGRLLGYPEFALLRGDPRLEVLRKKVGLPE